MSASLRVNEMIDEEYTIDQIRRLVAPIAKQYGVERVYLFGSYATNTATAFKILHFLPVLGTL